MEYNWMTQNDAQSYPYMAGFTSDSAVLGVSNASIANLEAPLDNPGYMPNTYNNFFNASMTQPNAGLAALPPSQSPSPGRHSAVQTTEGSIIDLDNSHHSGTSNNGDLQRRRSSSAEKDVTPAQSRRKAQNRAAQRAFRERKERHVRDLEAKLNLLTTTTSSLQSDNERLKLMLQRAQTENEILRASAAARSTSPSRAEPLFIDDPSTVSSTRQPKVAPGRENNTQFDPTRLAHGLMSASRPRSPGRIGSPSGSESHLLSASATWDLLQSHPLYLSGAVDIGEVCERLKKMAKCDGMGPMFDEEEVRKVIEELGRGGHDGLI